MKVWKFNKIVATVHGHNAFLRPFNNNINLHRNFYRPRRSLLYVPGNDERKIQKIPTLNADCVVLDCEDGVALNQKTAARDVISKTLRVLPRTPQTELSVRINSIESGLAEDDLGMIFEAGQSTPEAIVVPKVENVTQVDWLVDQLLKKRHRSDLSSLIRLIVLIESARSFLDMDCICYRFQERLQNDQNFKIEALIFGSDDFSANIGASRTKEATEILYARQHFVIVTKAHQLQAIDMVYIDYKDLDGLRKQCLEGSQMGFTGKQVIHPGQVDIVNETFTPSKEKIEWATELISSFDEHQKTGKGAFTFHGSMIDMPLLRQAQNIIRIVTTIKDSTHK